MNPIVGQKLIQCFQTFTNPQFFPLKISSLMERKEANRMYPDKLTNILAGPHGRR